MGWWDARCLCRNFPQEKFGNYFFTALIKVIGDRFKRVVFTLYIYVYIEEESERGIELIDFISVICPPSVLCGCISALDL